MAGQSEVERMAEAAFVQAKIVDAVAERALAMECVLKSREAFQTVHDICNLLHLREGSQDVLDRALEVEANLKIKRFTLDPSEISAAAVFYALIKVGKPCPLKHFCELVFDNISTNKIRGLMESAWNIGRIEGPPLIYEYAKSVPDRIFVILKIINRLELVEKAMEVENSVQGLDCSCSYKAEAFAAILIASRTNQPALSAVELVEKSFCDSLKPTTIEKAVKRLDALRAAGHGSKVADSFGEARICGVETSFANPEDKKRPRETTGD
jgi:hypothetical protein